MVVFTNPILRLLWSLVRVDYEATSYSIWNRLWKIARVAASATLSFSESLEEDSEIIISLIFLNYVETTEFSTSNSEEGLFLCWQ